MKATALLTKQHREVRTIFKQLEKGNGQSNALLAKLATNLAAHMAIEQEFFYPAVLKVKKDLILEAYEEHEVARFALNRLLKTPVSDRTFKAKVTTLKEVIEHHVEEEEEDLFPASEAALGSSSHDLCTKMKARFEETKSGGYERALGKGGSAVTSASAPQAAQRR
jgi:predicted DNA-binding protein